MERFTFLSDGWLGAMQQIAQRLLDESEAPTRTVRYVEIFTGAPAAGAPAAGTPAAADAVTGYVLSFANGKASVVKAERDDEPADCTVRIDYHTALATMKVKSGPELNAIGSKAFADGSMTMSGSPKDLPISMNNLHDALFDRTKT